MVEGVSLFLLQEPIKMEMKVAVRERVFYNRRVTRGPVHTTTLQGAKRRSMPFKDKQEP